MRRQEKRVLLACYVQEEFTSQEARGVVRSAAAEVPGACEPLDIGPENLAGVLWKSSFFTTELLF